MVSYNCGYKRLEYNTDYRVEFFSMFISVFVSLLQIKTKKWSWQRSFIPWLGKWCHLFTHKWLWPWDWSQNSIKVSLKQIHWNYLAGSHHETRGRVKKIKRWIIIVGTKDKNAIRTIVWKFFVCWSGSPSSFL